LIILFIYLFLSGYFLQVLLEISELVNDQRKSLLFELQKAHVGVSSIVVQHKSLVDYEIVVYHVTSFEIAVGALVVDDAVHDEVDERRLGAGFGD